MTSDTALLSLLCLLYQVLLKRTLFPNETFRWIPLKPESTITNCRANLHVRSKTGRTRNPVPKNGLCQILHSSPLAESNAGSGDEIALSLEY